MTPGTPVATPPSDAPPAGVRRAKIADARVCVLTSAHSVFDTRIFHKQCRSLARAGFDVTLVAPHDRNEDVDGVRVVGVRRALGRLSRMSVGVLRVLRAALREKADIYHFHDTELIPVGLFLATLGKRVIYDIHEDVPDALLSRPYLPGWSRSLVSWLVDQLERLAARMYTALVPATPAIASRFASVTPPSVIVQNFPSLEEFPTGPAGRWNERHRSLAYVGVMSRIRGMVQMVEAMSLLPAHVPATLELAGLIDTPALQGQLQSMPGWCRVADLGFLTRAEVGALLNRARAGLVLFHPEPNHVAAYPTKMFEYMAAGLPVIASDFPLWRRIVEDAGCGLVVNPMDPAAIAKAIEYILTHDREAEAMGRAGREAVVRGYSWEAEEPKLIDLYRRIVSRAGEPRP